ncbi:MAG: hypothetical protein IKO80_08565 [Lachnospiraceae bacterium]|nr:hypothetical protein [Lachnospiraceae bacterium]
MAQKNTDHYGTMATEVKPSVNRAVARAKKAAAKTAAKKKASASKAAQKKAAAAKKAPLKSPGEKALEATRRKAVRKKPTNVVLQYSDLSVNYRTIVENARKIWRVEHHGKLADLTGLDLYIKPEEGKVYYVFNDEIAGDFPLG